MNLQPTIQSTPERILIGKQLTITFANNQTAQLWKSFMPRKKEIKNTVSSNLFSLQIYPPSFFISFNPSTPFQKWAAVEVSTFETVPEGMETFKLESGLYAVFYYKGPSSDPKIFEYIYGTWLPLSKEYVLDDRPHFELLGEGYKNNDPTSEEEIWIPIKLKIR